MMEEELQREFSRIRASLISYISVVAELICLHFTLLDALLKAQELLDRRNKLLLEDDRLVTLELELLQALERENEKELLWAKDELDGIQADKRAVEQALQSAKEFDSYQAWEAVVECLRLEFLGSSSECEGR
ncbi:hypothetical protein M0R45_017190 [Rubus argutus]|uniref:Uncharacterized protein n=1 Tax=Rubus argutus TaxID=59490 RepID=A0AAW1XVF0_RUBAR